MTVVPRDARWIGWGDGSGVDSLTAIQSHTSTSGHTRSGIVWFAPTAFDWSGTVAWGRDRIVSASGDRLAYRRWENGSLSQIVRVEASPSVRTVSDVEPIRDWAARSSSSFPVSEYLAHVQMPDTVPFFGEVRVDEVGRVWLADYQPDPEELPNDSTRWTVFTSEGHPIMRVVTPFSVDVLEIGRDYLLVRLKDELEVESIGVFALATVGE